MANETKEPRALSAALAGPAFHTRGGGVAMHAANRHVERWAPESGANRVRSMRSLGFVDRLVAPWIETAQRSASMRLFSQYTQSGMSEREGGAVSWVFPRPWYQDELDWMAAARQVTTQTEVEQAPAPTLLTTRGTYVPPVRSEISAPPTVMPAALYEYVAPSLSLATPQRQSAISGVGYGGSNADAYSSLVPLAAVQAAELMSRAVAPLVTTRSGTTSTVGRMSPALRTVLTTMLERAATVRVDQGEPMQSRIASQAPELVTPPHPRAGDFGAPSRAAAPTPESYAEVAAAEAASPAGQLAAQYAEQRARIVDLQKIARQSAERELAARTEPAQQARAAELIRAEETRAAARRAETELRERTTQTSEATRTAAVAAERARIEERVAQRIAERTQQTQTQRLHEQARSEAAAHARATIAEQAASTPAPARDDSAPLTERRAPAEMAAAIAALPPELAAFLSQRPERAVQAMAELGEALRTAELIARSSASGTAFEATRGPRLMMPAGLGGLVAAVGNAQAIQERPSMLAGERAFEPLAMAAPQRPLAAPSYAPRRSDARVPSLPWLTAPQTSTMSMSSSTARSMAPSTALGATASSSPAALSHVAWADRWLARFAGATPQSLQILQAASGGSVEQRMQALAAAAPGEVFVAPIFDTEMMRTGRAMPMSSEMTFAAPTVAAAAPASAPVERYADDAETPDDVFAQIAAAAATKRATPIAAPQIQTSAPAASAAFAPTGPERYTLADAVAHAAPSAPGAGLSAQLASSPFAPALRHVMPLPSAASFDIRSLFGSGLSATYLAGLLGSSAQELDVAGAASAPVWGSWAAAEMGMIAPTEREVPGFDPTYVAPELADQPARMATDRGEVVAPDEIASLASAPLTTLRTALLSWNIDTALPTDTSVAAPTSVTSQTSSAITTTAARAMLESMSLPMLGETMPELERSSSWTSPGMLAERAHGWSVAQERSASDLAMDFVTPELVLAARVYGLGPAEAAQAARLALGGQGQLTAMAGAVDRTFVQAMAIEADRRSHLDARSFDASSGAAPAARAQITTAFPTADGEIAAAVGPSPSRAMTAPVTSAAPGSAFGVDRRAPRGAFLWPSATVAALGLHAAAPDGMQSMSVAALELLAAQAVAEIGTYAALSDRSPDGAIESTESTSTSASATAARSPFVGPTVGSAPASGDAISEPGESDVLGAAAALVPASRRARFDALYVALSQSPTGRAWSPAARAARALALAGRGGSDDAPVSAYERAATAWDVLPVVYATDGTTIVDAAEASLTQQAGGSSYGGGTLATGGRRTAGGATRRDAEMINVDSRPGLGSLSSRAGEALGSYVTPSIAAPSPSSNGSSSSSSAPREMGAAMRAPTAAQEMVRTGRPSGRHGGGEVEIPTWFEAAARKMLEDRSGNADGISMAELTLVTAAPSSHVAASTRGAPSAAPIAPGMGSMASQSQNAPQIDIEKVANEVYRQILVMMDAARARNGEPYL